MTTTPPMKFSLSGFITPTSTRTACIESLIWEATSGFPVSTGVGIILTQVSLFSSRTISLPRCWTGTSKRMVTLAG